MVQRALTIRLRRENDLVSDFEASEVTKELTPDAVRAFQKLIYHYYQEHGRTFPWRMTHNPYHILVSEIMLQQTQTERVVEKYGQFINSFPDFSSLAKAPLREILRAWQGLGYNRRAIALKKIAQTVMTRFHGNLPSSLEQLMTLPGIGRATASAICAFAFNQPVVFIETNIRRVFIHHFFQNRNSIMDTEILPLVEKTLDTSNPGKWYFALMDYGVMVKKERQNPNRRSAHYQKQTPFEGSNRQIRGMILKALAIEHDISETEITKRLDTTPERVRKNLIQLQEEGFLKKKGNRFTIV
ncbi:MAG: A/G-specific adenine glycosylase [Thermodesulfobacteriota bacterium]